MAAAFIRSVGWLGGRVKRCYIGGNRDLFLFPMVGEGIEPGNGNDKP